MYKRHVIGKIGEELATKYLQENDYIILARNFSCRQGEIDIIAKLKNEIVFVEVKTRTNCKYGKPAEAVNSIKQKHIRKTAEYFMLKNNISNNNFIRLDVIEVYIKDYKYKINHIKRM